MKKSVWGMLLMRFKFNFEESKIYDFLYFPRMLYYMEEFQETKVNENFDEIVSEEYLSFVRKAEEKLKPFSDEIEIFYMKQYSSSYDFIELISRKYEIIGYKTEMEYINMIRNLSEEDIKNAIVYSIMLSNEEHLHEDDKIRKVEDISSNKEKLLSFIKELPVDSGTKWTLFLMVESPKEYMNRYINLMTGLLPLFNEIYSPFENEIREYGKHLVDFLNENGEKGLKEITYSVIDSKILSSGDINLFISVVFSYAVSLFDKEEIKYIVWGLRMEEAFRKMKEINENKIVERVQIFKNLGDKTRYEVLKLIAEGETSVKNIANQLGVSSATISYHINNFLTSKIIKFDKGKNKLNYVIDYELLEEVIKGLKEDLRFPE